MVSHESLEGDGRLQRVSWRHAPTAVRDVREICHVFAMTGADANTAWLEGCLTLDDQRFVKTGADLTREESRPPNGRCGGGRISSSRACPGVRGRRRARRQHEAVASAVGEGSAAVQLIHKALAE